MFKLQAVWLVWFCGICFAGEEEPALQLPTTIYHAGCSEVVEGDTIDLMIDLGFSIQCLRRVRLLRVDTPEQGAAGFEKAREYVKKNIVDTLCIVKLKQNESTGLVLAEIWYAVKGKGTVAWHNLNSELLAKGLGVPYVEAEKAKD